MVRHERSLALERGRNTVRFTDVAALIDPTTVAFESLTDSRGTHVVEQNFQFDLVNTAKLLQKYIDRSISVDQVRGSGVESYAGTLLSVSGGLVLRMADGTRENLYLWVNWTIAHKTHDFQKEDARTIHFPVKIAAGAEATVRYTAHYSW